jgi:hypothetical protein
MAVKYVGELPNANPPHSLRAWRHGMPITGRFAMIVFPLLKIIQRHW